MTTSPSSPSSPHQARGIAQSFGIDPQRYDRTRAPYPQAMIERIVSAASGPEFLNVGSGTGIEARQFVAAGRTVLGVEPDARMADFARDKGLEVEVATFEEWDSGGRMFDAVICGTAWHWVDPLAGAAKAGRILRVGGVLAPFGHVYEPPTPVAKAIATAFRRVAPDSPVGRPGAGSIRESYRGIYDRAADAIRAVGGFAEPEVWRYDWERDYTRDELLDLVPTSGGMTTLPAEQVAEVLSEVGAAVDEVGGVVTMPYTTWGLTAVRVAD
ncbi:MAG TPA: class I SAM-dependent methyltransferase [Pseudonocardiaceae bacterium]|jgi:SAM-dependent methyltransferase